MALYKKSIIVILLAFQFLTCDNPTEPEEVEKEYKVYFYEQSGSNKLYIYSTVKNVLDSVVLPYPGASFIQVSPNGELLYMVGAKITIIETESFSFVDEITLSGVNSCALSPDNKYIALTGKGFYLLSTSDFELLYADATTETRPAYFSEESQSVYWSAYDERTERYKDVYRLDLSSEPFVRTEKAFERRSITSIKVSSDEKLWFLTDGHLFDVYDAVIDSIIFHWSGCGGIRTEISPDNKHVYFTHFSSLLCIPDPNIQIYDIENNNLNTELSSEIASLYIGSLPDSVYPASITDVRLSVDNNKFMFGVGDMGLINKFYSIDLTTMEFAIRHEPLDGNHFISNLTKQLY